MLRDRCERCNNTMPVSTGQFCPECDAYRSAYMMDLKKQNPEASEDQILYAARRQMQATGWHGRSGYQDPRNFTRGGAA